MRLRQIASRRQGWLAAALAAVAFAGCGGGSSTAPSGEEKSGGGSGGGSGPTITITSSGVSPKSIEVSVGGRVIFVNNDRVFHEMQSDPHPEHTDCPEIGEVGPLSPGQTKQTGVFRTARTCGYHDHGQDTNTALQGTIVIR
jgi:plastocyanin